MLVALGGAVVRILACARKATEIKCRSHKYVQFVRQRRTSVARDRGADPEAVMACGVGIL